MTAKWQPGALRQAIIAELGARAALSAGLLARHTGWSIASVRRELALMEQLGLIRSATPKRTALWSLTRGGEIVWLLDREGEQKTYVLALSIGTSPAVVNAEAVRLVHLGLIRGRSGQAWRLAGKAAP